jgi:2-methylisocitrate lyase-like PEP mutase family enzyme
MTTTSAAQLRRLHQTGLLIMANAWDGGSARLVESLGAKAIATTSAGVAWAHGYADGSALPVALLLETVRDIARIVRVPVSVDMEDGYSREPAAVGANVADAVQAGAAGINIEDGSEPVELLCAKIAAIRSTCALRSSDVFINVRTDVYLRGFAPPGRRVDETLARAAKYRAAGAEGLFVPGVTDPGEIRALAAGAGLPLNAMARRGVPPAAELAALGVRRLSAGAAIPESVYGHVATLAAAFLRDGNSDAVLAGAMDYPAINALMVRS